MELTIYIPYTKPPPNIPFIKTEIEKFCHSHQIKGKLDQSRYIYTIEKIHTQQLFFILFDHQILTIPTSVSNLKPFTLKTNKFNITITFEYSDPINPKKSNLLSRFTYKDTSNLDIPIVPKIKDIIIEPLSKYKV